MHRAARRVTVPGGEQLLLPAPGDPSGHLPTPGDGPVTNWGTRLTPATARRIGCDSALYRVVLAPGNTPIAASTTARTAPPVLRRLLAARDGHCRSPGCDMPQQWTDAHHIKFWGDGGPTVLSNLVLLCGFPSPHPRPRLEFGLDGRIVTVHRPDGTLLTLPGNT